MRFTEVVANKLSIAKRASIHGVGVNDAWYMVAPTIDGKKYYCPYYRVWRSMITRCYSKSYQARHPTYINCVVCEEWLVFSNFRKWMEQQDWRGKELDKDILKPGNKIYSPSTCVFVDRYLNTLLPNRRKENRNNSCGLRMDKRTGRYIAVLSIGGTSVYLGSYKSKEKAENVYVSAKHDQLVAIANQQEGRIRSALLDHASRLKCER